MAKTSTKPKGKGGKRKSGGKGKKPAGKKASTGNKGKGGKKSGAKKKGAASGKPATKGTRKKGGKKKRASEEGDSFEYSYYSGDPVFSALKGKVITVSDYSTMKDRWTKEKEKKAKDEKDERERVGAGGDEGDEEPRTSKTAEHSDQPKTTKKRKAPAPVKPSHEDFDMAFADPEKQGATHEWRPGLHKSTLITVHPRPGKVGDQYNGKLEGLGTLMEKNGTYYIGELRHSRKHGYGHSVFIDKSTHTGGYKHGQKHGHGIEVLADGTTYLGVFRKNVRHGKGTLKNKDGTEWTGFFVLGSPVQDAESEPEFSSTSSLSGRARTQPRYDERGGAISDSVDDFGGATEETDEQ